MQFSKLVLGGKTVGCRMYVEGTNNKIDVLTDTFLSLVNLYGKKNFKCIGEVALHKTAADLLTTNDEKDAIFVDKWWDCMPFISEKYLRAVESLDEDFSEEYYKYKKVKDMHDKLSKYSGLKGLSVGLYLNQNNTSSSLKMDVRAKNLASLVVFLSKLYGGTPDNWAKRLYTFKGSGVVGTDEFWNSIGDWSYNGQNSSVSFDEFCVEDGEMLVSQFFECDVPGYEFED